jgi:cell division transport system permease protein
VSPLALHGFAWRLARRMVVDRPATLVLAVLMVALTLAPAFLVGLVAFGVRQSVPIERLAPEAVIFVARGTPGSEVAALRDRIRQLAGIDEVTWISRDAAWQDLGKRAGMPPSEIKANPLPDVLVVRLRFGAAVTDLEQSSAAIAKLGKVDAVQADWGWYQRLERWVALAKELAVVAVVLAGAMSLLILAAAARLLAQAVPEDLRVLALLGAEPAFVRRPFALVGAAVTTLGTVAAAAAVLVALRFVDPLVQSVVQGYGLDWSPMSPEPVWLAAAVGVAGLLGAVVGRIGWGRADS